MTKGDLQHAREWYAAGFTDAMKTPDDTLVFVTPEEKKLIRTDQAACMGCLSQCASRRWADNEKNSTGRLADPRSFCIQKTLQEIAHGGPVEENLMFAGHCGVPLQERPVLFERLRADREAARRSHPDGGLMLNRGRGRVAARVATAASAQDKTAALLGVDRQRRGDDAHRAGPQLSRHLAVQAPRPAGPGRQDLSQLAQDRGSRTGPQGWMLVTLLSDRRTAIVKPGSLATSMSKRIEFAASATAPKPASSDASRNATAAGARSRSASAKALSHKAKSGERIKASSSIN